MTKEGGAASETGRVSLPGVGVRGSSRNSCPAGTVNDGAVADTATL